MNQRTFEADLRRLFQEPGGLADTGVTSGVLARIERNTRRRRLYFGCASAFSVAVAAATFGMLPTMQDAVTLFRAPLIEGLVSSFSTIASGALLLTAAGSVVLVVLMASVEGLDA